MLTGILFGLGAATCQSLSYLCSRMFLAKFGAKASQLLILGHLVMAIYALVLLPFVWPENMPAFGVYAFDLIACTVFYLYAQISFFMALKKTEASKLSPLLGLKIFILAIIYVIFMGRSYTGMQWLAVVMGVCAAMLVNWSGGKIPKQSIAWILSACIGYCLSDIFIRQLVDNFTHLSLFHRSCLSTSLAYILCGAISLAIMPFFPRPKKGMIKFSVPFATAWFVAMLLLFACFGQIDVVYGNIIQSTRGVISVIMGGIVAYIGYEALEEKVTAPVLARRIIAALMMSGAITFFYLGS